jgi:hypothetical protein
VLISSTGASHWISYVRGGPVETACGDFEPAASDAI